MTSGWWWRQVEGTSDCRNVLPRKLTPSHVPSHNTEKWTLLPRSVQPIGFDDRFDDSIAAYDAPLPDQGCTNLNAEECREFGVGSDLALPGLCFGALF